MDTDYYSIESILAENQKLQCEFLTEVPNLGYIDGGSEKDIKPHAKMLLPYWLAPTLLYHEWVEIAIPAPYSVKVKKALEADARNVKLSNLVGGTGTWYGFGKMILDLLDKPENKELADVLTKTFSARLIDLMDQAHHFGGSVGGGNDGTQGGGEFREGLDATERELFALAQDSVKRTKEWYEGHTARG